MRLKGRGWGEQMVLGPKNEAWPRQQQAVSLGAGEAPVGGRHVLSTGGFGLQSASQERIFSGLKMRVTLGARTLFCGPCREQRGREEREHTAQVYVV